MKRFLLSIIVVLIVIAIALYAMGYWTANVEEGQLPKVNVEAQGGKLPDLDVDTNLTLGTTETNIGAPGIGIEHQEVKVPVIGVENSAETNQAR